MITRDKLITTIENCVMHEDAVVPLYTQHISSTIFLSEFDPELRSQLISELERLGKDSRRHKATLEALLDTIKESDRDVY